MLDLILFQIFLNIFFWYGDPYYSSINRSIKKHSKRYPAKSFAKPFNILQTIILFYISLEFFIFGQTCFIVEPDSCLLSNTVYDSKFYRRIDSMFYPKGILKLMLCPKMNCYLYTLNLQKKKLAESGDIESNPGPTPIIFKSDVITFLNSCPKPLDISHANLFS